MDVGTGACTLTVVSSIACPPGDKTNIFAPISPPLLTARLSYTDQMTGAGASSSVGWTGGVELTSVTTTVPDPSTVVLMSVGLMLLGGVARQRLTQSCAPRRRREARRRRWRRANAQP